jgi:hypothetical protein
MRWSSFRAITIIKGQIGDQSHCGSMSLASLLIIWHQCCRRGHLLVQHSPSLSALGLAKSIPSALTIATARGRQVMFELTPAHPLASALQSAVPMIAEEALLRPKPASHMCGEGQRDGWPYVCESGGCLSKTGTDNTTASFLQALSVTAGWI